MGVRGYRTTEGLSHGLEMVPGRQLLILVNLKTSPSNTGSFSPNDVALGTASSHSLFLAPPPPILGTGDLNLCPSRLTEMPGVSSRKRALTDTSASSGHSWNQLMAVQLTTAGNFLARTRRTEPTGEKHRITWTWDTGPRLTGMAGPSPGPSPPSELL